MAKRNTLVTDPIADMLTRIRNAGTARHEDVQIPFSKIKMDIAKILAEEGFIKTCELVTAEGDAVTKKTQDPTWSQLIKITFKGDSTNRVIQGLRRISKPGLRVYSGKDELPRVLNGLGIAIISTSKGIMTDKKAREKKLGGEVLAYVW
ncbi:MAG: 30S ribosomal protein S8 [Christensenellaceae bacterium]|jgi:small subunit ribosomal protein S8|nr:30S ribosomal protein S8 [Christensenellaceae bacterium]